MLSCLSTFSTAREVQSLEQCLKLVRTNRGIQVMTLSGEKGPMTTTHSERCEAEAARLEGKAVSLGQLLGVLLGEDDYVKSVINRHKQDAELYRHVAARYRGKGL